MVVMFPRSKDGATSDDEVSAKKKGKKLNPATDDGESKIIFESPISKFLTKNNTLVKRYLVLNQYGLFVYKDEINYKSFPHKPAVVIPIQEIESVKQREFTA